MVTNRLYNKMTYKEDMCFQRQNTSELVPVFALDCKTPQFNLIFKNKSNKNEKKASDSHIWTIFSLIFILNLSKNWGLLKVNKLIFAVMAYGRMGRSFAFLIYSVM